MNRDFWTIYDDDSMEFEQELDREEEIIRNMGLDTVMTQVLRRLNGLPNEEKKTDHFEDESDLFEV